MIDTTAYALLLFILLASFIKMMLALGLLMQNKRIEHTKYSYFNLYFIGIGFFHVISSLLILFFGLNTLGYVLIGLMIITGLPIMLHITRVFVKHKNSWRKRIDLEYYGVITLTTLVQIVCSIFVFIN